MKITIAQGPFLPVPPLLGGAIEKFFFPLAQHWASLGHTVTHLSRAYPNLPASETLRGVRHLRVPSADASRSGLWNKFLDLRYAARIAAVLPEADILLTHTFFLPLLAQPRHGRLYIHAGRFPQGQLSLYRRAARIQFPSTAILDAALAQAPALRDRFTVIPYALPFLPPTPAPRPALTPPHRLLYAGRLHPEKGLELLLRALALLPPVLQSQLHLRLVGPHATTSGGGGEAFLARLRTLAARTSARVDFPGPLFDTSALAAEYATADLFVYPSLADRGETFGVAPLEALSHGTPVLLSALPCFRDFLRPFPSSSANGFSFDHHAPNPAAALASALREALSQSALWPALSAQAAATAAHFSLEKISALYIKDFEKILHDA